LYGIRFSPNGINYDVFKEQQAFTDAYSTQFMSMLQNPLSINAKKICQLYVANFSSQLFLETLHNPSIYWELLSR